MRGLGWSGKMICAAMVWAGWLTVCEAQRNQPEIVVRVLSFNIRYGRAPDGPNAWPHRRRLVLEVLRTREWDFVGLQEALRFQLDELESALPHLAEIGVGRQDGRTQGEYAALLYDFRRWAVARAGTFWLSDTPDVPGSTSWGNRIPRVVTWARFVHKKTAQAVWVFNTHFDHASAAARDRSAQALAQRIAQWTADEPVILTGDLNAGEDSYPVRYLCGAHASPVNMKDTFRLVHPRATQVGTFNAFEGKRSGEKIDYVLVQGPWEVRQAEILNGYAGPVYPSDHWPVWAQLVLRSSQDRQAR